MGFLEAAGDVDGILKGVSWDTNYFGVVRSRGDTWFKIEEYST